MGMDLCYYGIKEENIPDILDGNFFEEDFSDSEPQHTLRVFSVKELYYVYSGGKELEEEDFQGKNERDLFIEAFLGEVTVSSPPEDIYSYCTCKEKVKEIANCLNKIDIKDGDNIFVLRKDYSIWWTDGYYQIQAVAIKKDGVRRVT